MAIVRGRSLGALLIEAGVAPEYARNIELHITLNDAMILRYDVVVQDKDLNAIADAIRKLNEAPTAGGG